MKFKLVFFILLVLLFQVVLVFSQKQSPKDTQETKFLQQLVGVWTGKGESLGSKTTDEMKFSWLFNKRFLKMNYKTLKGKDIYTSEGFIWFNTKTQIFEYYDFNDGIWAIRKGIGKMNENSLMINETREEDGTQIELTFEFIDKNTLKVVEFYTQNQVRKPLADYTFKRQLLKGK
jgi:hypothetical protein